MYNREIKFRAWDNEYKVMMYPKAHYIGESKFNNQETKDKAWEDYDIWELYNTVSNEYVRIIHYKTTTMQYTWLKDSSWVEIYEWDILWFRGKTKNFVQVKYYDDWYKCRVHTSPVSIRTTLLAYFLQKYNCYISWNIYENPDLINQ